MTNTDLGALPRAFVSDRLEEDKEYWLAKLGGETAATGLPLDFTRPARFGGRNASCPLDLDPAATARLLEICRGADSLVFAALVTVLKLCLFKYTGAEDVIVGTGIHEQHAEVAPLNKVLALRSRVSGDMTARQLLEDVRLTLAEAYAHQRFPFERLLELLSVETAPNRAPLFSVAAILENINSRANIQHSMHDATLVFSIRDGQLGGVVEYNQEIFAPASIKLFARHYGEVLRDLLDRPEARISGIEMLSPERRREILFDFNATESAYPKNRTVHALISERAARTPGAVAVRHGERLLSYAELERRLNGLARYLRGRGVGRGARVGIYLAHSPETLIALLGVLKSGAAYVPFEPAHPASRLSFMLKDAGIALVLTEERLSAGVRAAGAEPINLDASPSPFEEAGELPADELADEARGEDLAYVMYTSGSTGEPKGVEIRHDSLVNYVWWAQKAYDFTEQTAVPLYSSLAFDLTVTSIYPPLIAGGSVIVYRQEGRESPLPEILRDDAVDVLKLTPSHLSLLGDRDVSESRVRCLIVGGEALETALAARVYESFGRRAVIYNEYGPTEATVGCMIHKFDPEADRRAFVPIGRPADNTRIYVLDKDLTPAAENVVGELYISGDGLARGYLNREELTAERFVVNPFVPGERMYRSGDLARMLPEGIVEFAGRADEQVKFNGYRVELNAIRCALNLHPQVKDSIIVVARDQHDHGVMVAYYVARHDLETAELRTFLSESIIEEMLPNVFVHLKRLPLTLNGKVNYRALPSLEEARQSLRRAFVAPETPTQQAVADIWSQVLGLERVGLHDNFFEVGGHSLLAMLILSRVRENFGVDLPLRNLFRAPTVAGIAEQIETLRWAAQGPPEPEAATAGDSHEEGLL